VSDSTAPAPAAPPRNAHEYIDDYFGIRHLSTTLGREVLAGVSTFLALSYIFVVNPTILGAAGFPQAAVLFATILVSGAATLAMGLWARLPFAVAPGLEMNGYVAFFVVGTLGFTWEQSLGLVLLSGLLMLAITATRIREKVILSIPDPMKVTLSLTVAVFIGLIALSVSGLVHYHGLGIAFQGFGSFTTRTAVVFYIALVSVVLLDRLHLRAAVLLSVLVATACAHLLGAAGGGRPVSLSSDAFAAAGQLDLGGAMTMSALSVVTVLFLLDFYGSIAKFIGLTMQTNIAVNGRVPRMTQALLVDGGATSAGACLGTTNLTTYVESAVGIGAGGRTGLTAVIVALLMSAVFFVAPLLYYVPLIATTGALVYVAYKLCPKRELLLRLTRVDQLAMLLAAVVLVLTFAVDRAMLAAFAVYLIGEGSRRRRGWRIRVNPYLAASVVLLTAGVVLQQIS
jgi:AGZA family xanthine/uracil permease-like MFS transporter